MGATGHTGQKIAEVLLRAGEKVRILGRSENKLAELKRLGAEVLVGNITEPAFLAKAFRGADAVYTLLPTDRRSLNYRTEQDRQGEATANAIRESGVGHIVFLSSLGAELNDGTGLIAGLHAQEERLKQSTGANMLFLRPGSFYENFYDSLALIKHQGINGDSVAPNLALPMVATRDIAHAASKALSARNWNGVVVRELLGPRDLTYTEATRIFGQHIGKPNLQYIQFSHADTVRALTKGGFSESFASLYVAMTQAFNEGVIKPREGRTPANATTTRFEDFASELAQAYQVL